MSEYVCDMKRDKVCGRAELIRDIRVSSGVYLLIFFLYFVPTQSGVGNHVFFLSKEYIRVMHTRICVHFG